jgi:hypothetical protein
VVTYTAEDGRKKTIQVGMKCVDLWVAPDESVIAFVAVERERPPQTQEMEPLIEESSIYIARRSDHFRPVHVNVTVGKAFLFSPAAEILSGLWPQRESVQRVSR